VLKSSNNFWLHFYFPKKLSKVNNRPIGENLPNLVTLCSVGQAGIQNQHLFLQFFVDGHAKHFFFFSNERHYFVRRVSLYKKWPRHFLFEWQKRLLGQTYVQALCREYFV
jgi:hypothetical protein